MKIYAKLFLESGNDYIIGPGRVELLRAIAELGSLRKAAEKLGMSYRWAWGRLKDAEVELGVALMRRTTKKIGGKPNSLTPEAVELLEWYAKMQESVTDALEKAQQSQPAFIKKIKKAKISTKKNNGQNCTEKAKASEVSLQE